MGNDIANNMLWYVGIKGLVESLGVMGIWGRENAIATRSSGSRPYSMVDSNEQPYWRMMANIPTTSFSDMMFLASAHGFWSRENSMKSVVGFFR